MSILNSLISIVSLNSQKHSIAYSSASFSNGDNFGLNHVSKLNKQTNTQTHNGRNYMNSIMGGSSWNRN